MTEWQTSSPGVFTAAAETFADEHTFDLTSSASTGDGNFEDQSRRVHDFCYHCRTLAKIAPEGVALDLPPLEQGQYSPSFEKSIKGQRVLQHNSDYIRILSPFHLT
jgi:hypothetical protein